MSHYKAILAILFLSLSNSAAKATEKTVKISNFSTGSLADWNTRTISGSTRYRIENQAGKHILKASSQGTASAIGRRVRIDLKKTPFINWRWRVDTPLMNLPETIRVGDDYSARLYVFINGGLKIWKSKSVNYLWSSNINTKNQRSNSLSAPNNVRRIVLRDQLNIPGKWVVEKRNVAKDFKYLFGFTPQYIDGVAVMSDTDNNLGEAASSFGEIFFTSK